MRKLLLVACLATVFAGYASAEDENQAINNYAGKLVELAAKFQAKCIAEPGDIACEKSKAIVSGLRDLAKKGDEAGPGTGLNLSDDNKNMIDKIPSAIKGSVGKLLLASSLNTKCTLDKDADACAMFKSMVSEMQAVVATKTGKQASVSVKENSALLRHSATSAKALLDTYLAMELTKSNGEENE